MCSVSEKGVLLSNLLNIFSQSSSFFFCFLSTLSLRPLPLLSSLFFLFGRGIIELGPEAIPTSSLPGTGERWLSSWNAVSGEQADPPYIFLPRDFYIRGTNRSTIYYNQIKFLTSPGPRDFYIKGNKQNLPKETMIKNDQRLLGKYYKVLHKLSFS